MCRAQGEGAQESGVHIPGGGNFRAFGALGFRVLGLGFIRASGF